MWTSIAFVIVVVALIVIDSRLLDLEHKARYKDKRMADLEKQFSEYKTAHMIDWISVRSGQVVTPHEPRAIKGPNYKDPTITRKDGK